MNFSPASDEYFMNEAIAQAELGCGAVSPNPPVGCVLVNNRQIIGRGFHQNYGGAHAEINALRDAAVNGFDTIGAAAFVSLMPCDHYGKTPPCTDALIAAKVSRVVVAVDDPNQMSGDGAAKLRAHNITVEIGVLSEPARRVMGGFLKQIEWGLPRIVLKYALTLDGKTALRDGSSQWISNSVSRERVQVLRSQSDAILIGGATFRRDSPSLTPRLKNPRHSSKPRRVIVSASLNIPVDSPSFSAANFADGGQWIILHARNEFDSGARQLLDRGIQLVNCAAPDGSFDLRMAAKKLADDYGIREILCEGGSRLNNSLLTKRLADEVAAFIAPKMVGGFGIGAAEGDEHFTLDHSPYVQIYETENYAGDFFLRGKIIYPAAN